MISGEKVRFVPRAGYENIPFRENNGKLQEWIVKNYTNQE
jgi:hypothetical protein